jgi:hypothetical protein
LLASCATHQKVKFVLVAFVHIVLSLRWDRFPWSNQLYTSMTFGLGLSYDFKFPEAEYRLEHDTKQLLFFW